MALVDGTAVDPNVEDNVLQKQAASVGEGAKTYQILSKILKWLAAFATLTLAVVILVLTLTPPNAAITGGINDKVLHFMAFATLVLPCAVFLKRRLGWTVIAAAMLGGIIELLQPSFGRDASWGDFLADICGVAVGVALGLALRFLIKRFLSVRGYFQNI